MGIFTRDRKPALPTMTLNELTSGKYDIIDVTGNAVLVAEKPKKIRKLADNPDGSVLGSSPDMRELGSTGQTIYGNIFKDDYNPEMRGHLGLEKYDRMRRSDGQVRGTLRLLKTPVLAARWYVEPFDVSDKNLKVAKFVWDNFTKWMSVSWPQFLQESLVHLDFGWYAFEKVWDQREIDGEMRTVLAKLSPRHPLDMANTGWVYDKNGGPNGCWFYSNDADEVFIPIRKLLCFTNDKEGGNMEGISILRSAYKHWFYKENLYKIDAIQKERHGIGVPVIKLPPGFKDQDKSLADEMGRNLRTNEKAHIVLPPNWDILMLKMEGQPVDALASAAHHDLQMARNILAQFLNDQRSDGSAISASNEIFTKSTRFVAEQIRDVVNKWLIPEMVAYNFKDIDEFPELRVRRIGDTIDWRTISFAMRNFIGAGVIKPDDKLEEWVRDEMDLPKPDPTTVRDILAPQNPGDGPPDGRPGAGGPATDAAKQNGGAGATPSVPRVGMPRQSQAKGMAKNSGSNGRVGRDAARK